MFSITSMAWVIEEIRPAKCFEIGVASGMSTTFLLMALAKLGPESALVSVDISRQYYADRSKQVDWSADAEKFAADKKFDFVFIDAHHSHPWATLDTMLVLPFVNSGAWVACHDIALHEIPRFARETGPFHVYESMPGPKKESQFDNRNIGAFQVAGSHRDYEDYLLAALAQAWTVSGVIKQSFYDRIFEVVERFYSGSFASQVRRQIEVHNEKIAAAKITSVMQALSFRLERFGTPDGKNR